MHNYDSPILNGQRYNVEIDTKTHTLKFSQQLFGYASYMIRRNTMFKKDNEKRKGYFHFNNKFFYHDNVQKNIIGILPF